MEISEHLYRVYTFIKSSDHWVTNKEIAKQAKIADRTARSHVLKLVRAGIVEVAEVYPGHRYRFTKKPAADRELIKRLQRAEEVFSEHASRR